MTPLMKDIEKLRQVVKRLHQYTQREEEYTELTSLEHVELIGVFRRIYWDEELMDQLQQIQAISRQADKEPEA